MFSYSCRHCSYFSQINVKRICFLSTKVLMLWINNKDDAISELAAYISAWIKVKKNIPKDFWVGSRKKYEKKKMFTQPKEDEWTITDILLLLTENHERRRNAARSCYIWDSKVACLMMVTQIWKWDTSADSCNSHIIIMCRKSLRLSFVVVWPRSVVIITKTAWKR